MKSSSPLNQLWLPGFQQVVFRCLIRAMSSPGEVVAVNHASAENKCYLGILATLADGAITLADPNGLVLESERRYLRVGNAKVEDAHFVLIDGSRPVPPAFRVSVGDIERPERGATVILSGSDVSNDGRASDAIALKLSGPGIDGSRSLFVVGLHLDWIGWRNENTRRFPLGVDLVLAGRRRLACIPRTSVLSAEE